ncbi:MAG: M16 family metallopeptidase [Gemmatimonadales bacterium]
MRLSCLTLLVALPLAAQQPARKSPVPGAVSPPLVADTAVHAGRLANGFRYWVRHNSYPEHRLELRLVVRAGSILEDTDQRGLAHFIEHMGFNGTTHFAKNDMVKYLESIGVKYGADLNANTGFDETQYILPVPSDKPELVARAFDILQDWAMGDKFDPTEVAGERGVVLGEWRSGLGAGSRIINQEIPVLFRGSRYAVRLPIGDTATIAHATTAPMKRFYHDWYRPDLMAVIAVGDYPVDSIERLIRSHFAAMRNPRPERPRTDAPVPDIPGTRVAVITDPEQPTEAVELLIRRPTTAYRTEADERRSLVSSLFGTIAAQRMQELARKPDAPFASAGFGSSGFIRDLQVFEVGVNAKEGKSAAAFEAALRELRRFDVHGVLPAELDRAKASLLRGRESAAAEQDKTESAVFLGAYINAFLRGNAVMSARDRYALTSKILPTITIDEVNAALREASRGKDRVVIVLGPDKAKATLPTRDTLLAILARTDTATLPVWVETTVTADLVPVPPRPGRIVSETTYTDVGVTDWRLSNGVRVLIKPTDFKADQLFIGGEAAGGLSLVPDDQVVNAGLAASVVQQSGVGAFDAVSLRNKLAGKIAFVLPQVDETSEGLIAFAAPKDLETDLQVLWLTATAPRLDTAAVLALRNQLRTALVNRGNTPTAVFNDTIRITMGRNSPRAQPMTVTRLESFDPHRALAIYQNWFHDFNDFTFVIVGRVNVDSLRPLVSQWLGGLPSAGGTHSWNDVAPVAPEGVITKVVYKGKEPVTQQVVLFSGKADSAGPETGLAADAAAEILQERLLDKLREAMGATYGVTANTSLDRVPRMRYRSQISFKSTPAQADTLWQAAQEIITAMRTTGPTADELQKFVAQARRESEVAAKTNDWWLGEISNRVMPDGPDLGRPLSDILSWGQRLDALTPGMVQDAAKRFFDPANVARFVLLPEK